MQRHNIVMSDIFTTAEVSKIMRLDARSLSSNPQKYCDQNRHKYMTLLNTWLYMCSQYFPLRSVDALKNCISMNGLIAVIGKCSDLANDVIASEFELSDLGGLRFLAHEDPRITLQVLRYPKRFSPCCADLLNEKGLVDFAMLNKSLRGEPSVIATNGKVLERDTHYPQFLVDGVRFYCEKLLGEFTWRDEERVIIDAGSFSNGVTAEGCHTKFEKYRAYARLTPGYKDPYLYPLPRYGNEDFGECDDIDYVKAVAVPKNYKMPRIIAEVSTKTQFMMQGIRRLAVQRLSKSKYRDLIVLDDQSINQEWSRLGSVYGIYCTIDITSASDSISNNLGRQILPKGWYRIIQKYNPKYILIKGQKHTRYILLTSGSGDTFVVESTIFLSVALFATDTVRLYTRDRTIKDPRVFGDDIACDAKVYDTLIDFLRMLGFTVNLQKSFGSGSYRESCGAEWWCGLDTATKYYPRRAFDETTNEYLEGMISLQHRLYEFVDAERWLTAYIQREFAKRTRKLVLTSSEPGTECGDLWSEIPNVYTLNPPHNGDGVPDSIKREGHTTLVASYPDIGSKEFNARFLDLYKRPFVPQDRRLCEMIRYVDFLQHGMEYDEFGVPIHKPPLSADLLLVDQTWRIVKR